MYSGNGLTRHLQLGNYPGAATTIGIYGPSSPFPEPYIEATGFPVTKIWGMVRYLPQRSASGAPVRRPTPNGLRAMLYGLSPDGMTESIWEALPWSWFIDYTYDVGTFLAANAGRRFLDIERACLMAHTTCEIKHSSVSHTDLFGRTTTVSAGTILRETKFRSPVYPPTLPTPHIPLLSAGQLSVLGSIIHLKTRGMRNS